VGDLFVWPASILLVVLRWLSQSDWRGPLTPS
jgi:hypothetical protein